MVTLSLVALQKGRMIGNIIFSPVNIESPAGKFPALGLGPLAVIPSCQKRGVGGALIQAGVETWRIAGHPAVVLVGHPGYYRRFGYVAAAALGLTSEFEVPRNIFWHWSLNRAPSGEEAARSFINLNSTRSESRSPPPVATSEIQV